MNLEQFCIQLESIAPHSLALDFDNVGLLITPDHDEIKRVLVALDLTEAVAEEAVKGEYDLVLTHHPIFLDPVRSISQSDSKTAAAYRLIRHGIGHFTAHTNLDACVGGVNDVLAEMLSLSEVKPLPPEGLGRYGTLPDIIPFRMFAERCETLFGIKGRFVGDPDQLIRTVAVIGGAGGGDAEAVVKVGCDAFVTGEMKHHQSLVAVHYGLCCCVLGHYETEFPVLKPLINRLQNGKNDVQYDLIQSGNTPMYCL